MQNFKERLYNHEATPPPEIWDNISAELDDNKYPGLPISSITQKI